MHKWRVTYVLDGFGGFMNAHTDLSASDPEFRDFVYECASSAYREAGDSELDYSTFAPPISELMFSAVSA